MDRRSKMLIGHIPEETKLATHLSTRSASEVEDLYPHLFSPMTLGGQRFRNRIALGSMFTGRARDGDVTPELIAFYANRAAGGAALIVTEALNTIRQRPAFTGQVRIYKRENLDSLRRWVDAIHQHDSGIIGQIQDHGRGDIRPRRKAFSFAPSALPDDLSWSMPHSMDEDEINAMRDDFVAGAVIMKRAGFNGIEVSAGHGHLHHQFLSPWMNRREDRYGGSRTNRMRPLVELIQGIRAACGDEFLIGLRLPGHDGMPHSIDWDEAGLIADELTKTCRVDYMNFVQGSQSLSLFEHLPDMHGPRSTYVEATARLKPFCNGIPMAATGRLLEPVQAETLLAQGQADFVMMARTLLADPAWGLKAQQNREGEIRKCVSCNNCWGEIVHHQPLACDNNPRVARIDEVDWWTTRTLQPRRLTVVGGGLAGLETAWVAAARGHHVTLFSQSSELGGKGRLYASMPDCEAVSSIYDYQIWAGQRAGVNYKTSFQAGIDDIIATAPDAIVLATGGEMLWPPQLPDEWREWGVLPDLWTAIGDLGRMGQDPGTAIVYDFDGTDVTYSAADALSHRFARVVIVTPVECVGRDEALVKRQSIYRRLLNRGIEIWPWSEPSSNTDLETGQFLIRNVMTGRESSIENVSFFTYATPRRQRDELLVPLRQAGYLPHVIGDAFIPRSTIATLKEAHALGEDLWREAD